MKDMVRNVRAAAKEMHALMCKIQKRASGLFTQSPKYSYKT